MRGGVTVARHQINNCYYIVGSLVVDLLVSCCKDIYSFCDASVSIKQPIPTTKFPSTSISIGLLSLESDIAIAFVNTSKSSGLKLSTNVIVTPTYKY